MLGDTLGAANARRRFAPKLMQRRPGLLLAGALLASAVAASAAWALWAASFLGADFGSLVRPGFAFAVVPLVGLGAWAALAAGRTASDVAVTPSDAGFGSVTFTLGSNLDLCSASPAFAGMFGRPAATVLGKKASLLIHPADQPAVSRLLAAMLAGAAPLCPLAAGAGLRAAAE